MTKILLANKDWSSLVARLGGAARLEVSARETKAFLRPRMINNAVDLLRLILAYCLGEKGLRLTSAWASSVGLVDISNVALLYRLRQCGDWLSMLVGQALDEAAPKASHARMIRIVDATTVPKAGASAHKNSALWRIHSAFELPHERFGHFELTDQRGGERLDRIPVVKGEIRLADRAYLQPDRMAVLLEAGADFVIRSGWRSACWLTPQGEKIDLISQLDRATTNALIDRPVLMRCKQHAPVALRLIAIRKPEQAAAQARKKACRQAQRECYQISQQALVAADWVILVTSLSSTEFSTDDILALYRLRWRIELGFKRLKSLIGLKGPPGFDERSAKPYVLAHLLMILLLEPLVDELEDSPRLAKTSSIVTA